MKRAILIILFCEIIVLGLTGCNKSDEKEKLNVNNDTHTFQGTIVTCEQNYMIVKPDESEHEYKSSDKFRVEYVNDIDTCNIGIKVRVTYKGGINETYPAQIGTTKIEIVNDLDFYITKPELIYDIRFNDYYKVNNRTIYLSGNLKEFYIKEKDKDITLKEYLQTSFQTLDDGIKSITDKLELKDTLRDGGTKIYKSKEKDITIIVCNTTKGDKNIFIGDYKLEYADGDCKK